VESGNLQSKMDDEWKGQEKSGGGTPDKGGRCRSVLLKPKRDARKTSPLPTRHQRATPAESKERAKSARVEAEELPVQNKRHRLVLRPARSTAVCAPRKRNCDLGEKVIN
jgi:hypothetical protein